MGAYLQQVVAKRRSPEATAHRVALFLATKRRRAVLTEAPSDCAFYNVLLSRLPANDCEIEFVSAFNRDGVLSALQLLDDLGKGTRSFGIVDRDFHFEDPETLADGRCLVLNVYSRENLLLDVNFVRQLSSSLFALEFDDPWRGRWSDAVEKFETTVPNALIKIHARAIVLKRAGLVCNLNNFCPSQVVSVAPGGEVHVGNDMEATFLRQTQASVNEKLEPTITAANLELEGINWRNWIRGHYAFKLLLMLINSFRETLDEARKAEKENRTKTKAYVHEAQINDLAAASLGIPDYIKKFFSRVTAETTN